MPTGQRVQGVRHRKYSTWCRHCVNPSSGIAQDEFETDVRSNAEVRVFLRITFRSNENVYGMQASATRRGFK